MNFDQSKTLFVLFVILLFSFFDLSQSEKTVACKKIPKNSKHAPKTCTVKVTEVIDAEDYQLTANTDALVLTFDVNFNISFLPIKIQKVFPHLRHIIAYACRITKITSENFEDLNELTDLNLSYNQIKELTAEVFKDLLSLVVLNLSESSIERIVLLVK